MSKMKIGIDKLVLTTKDFRLPTVPRMIPVYNTELGESLEDVSPIATTTDGQEIRAQRLYKDTRRLKTCTNVSINRNGLQLTFNPNSHYHEYKTYSDPKRLEESYKAIQSELKEIGILADVGRMTTYRIDTNNDCVMSKPYAKYKPVFDSLNASRMKVTSHTTGVTIKNKSAAAVFYDKVEDQLNKTGQLIAEENLLRNEVRLLNTGVVQRHASFLSQANNIIRHYDHKDEVHLRKMDTILKSLKPSTSTQLLFKFEDDIVALNHFLETQKKNKLQQFLSVFGGIEYILDKYGNIQSFEINVIDMLDAHRQTKKRFKETLRDLYHQNKFIASKVKNRHKELDSMTNEIFEKFSRIA